MSQAISTNELAHLVLTTQKILCGQVRQAFNRAASPDEAAQDRIFAADADALRAEARRNPRLRDAYQRMLLLSVLERTEHGLGIVAGRHGPQTNAALARRAARLDDGQGGNLKRALALEALQAPVLAKLFRAA